MHGFVLLIDALAWPLAAVVIALVFRGDVRAMIARVGRVKYRDVEVTFLDEIRHAEAMAKALPAPGRVILELASAGPVPEIGGEIIGGLRLGPEDLARLDRLAARSPREAVLEAWDLVGGSLAAPGPAGRLVEQLRALRDRAARPDGPAPTPEEARRYIGLAGRIRAMD